VSHATHLPSIPRPSLTHKGWAGRAEHEPLATWILVGHACQREAKRRTTFLNRAAVTEAEVGETSLWRCAFSTRRCQPFPVRRGFMPTISSRYFSIDTWPRFPRCL
jgi:hypothetical protein